MPTRPIKSLAVTFHGIDSPSYFPGHGVALTRFTDCATGTGDTEYDAIQDALEQLCQRDLDLDTPEARDMLDRVLVRGFGRNLAAFERLDVHAHAYCEHDDSDTGECDMQFYVSIDVEIL